jgi:hypothetical protein
MSVSLAEYAPPTGIAPVTNKSYGPVADLGSL